MYMQTNSLDYASEEEQQEYDLYVMDLETLITEEEAVKIEANMITEYEITYKRSTTDVDLNEDDETLDGENVWYS
jgi:enolase|tara:strand:- start:316 stop:540 length:225 start_codon:yes stop_codon:yes gene_type:complete